MRILSATLLFLLLTLAGCGILGGDDATPPPDAEYFPPSNGDCRELANATRRTLDLDPDMVDLVDDAEFVDVLGEENGLGCEIRIQETGLELAHFQDVAVRLRRMFEELGWQEDPQYLADGPTGTATAFRKDRRLALLSVDWEPAADIACPEDRPISECNVPPEKQIYTVVVAMAQRELPEERIDEAAVAAIRAYVADTLDVAPEAVVMDLQPVNWASTCLGVYLPDQACAQKVTPGYGGMANVNGLQYEVHADASGDIVYLIPGAALSARQVLAQQLQLDLNQVTILSHDPVNWPDACLGVAMPDALCAQAVTPGYVVTLAANGGRYVFHTDRDGGVVKLAQAPEVQVQNPLLSWSNSEVEGCQTAIFTYDAVIFGACQGPLVRGMYAFADRAAALGDYIRTYASFEAATSAGAVRFAGQGSQVATPAEQRMIAEWARLTALEARGGRSGASYGLVMAWHREGGIAGFCDDLTVYATGDIYASDCRGGEPQTLGHRRLSAELLEQFYAWVDTYRGFEYEQIDPATADAMTVRLLFSGNGELEPPDDVKQEMENFAALIYAQFAP